MGERAAGLPIAVITDDGPAAERIAWPVGAMHPDLVLVPTRYRDLASSLACPVTVVPGAILAPVDSGSSPAAAIDRIVLEAQATGSKVLVLGVVPVHLYSREEKEELERVRKETVSSVNELKKALAEKGIEALEALRSGYPDEEILKAAAEHAVSLILLPPGSTTPSELSKAASILLDESEGLKWPVFLLPPAAV
ncbi:MAG: universal stress protein [Nitrospirota bacterium]